MREAIEQERRDARRRAQLGSEAMLRLEAAEACRQQERAASRAAMLAVWKLGEKATTLVSKHTKQPYPSAASSPSRPAVLQASPLLLSLAASGVGGGGMGTGRRPSRAQSASTLRPRRTASGGGALSRPHSSLPRPHPQQLRAQQAQQAQQVQQLFDGMDGAQQAELLQALQAAHTASHPDRAPAAASATGELLG
jgi:hypothetical protein